MVRTTEDGRATHAAATADAYSRRTNEYRPLAELVHELRDETTDLVRNEVKLAKLEIGEKVSRVGRNSAYTAVGGVITSAALVILMFAATAGVYAGLVRGADLENMMAGWLAPLIVGGVGAVLGYVLIRKGVNSISSEGVVPERTAETLRDDKEWLERKVR